MKISLATHATKLSTKFRSVKGFQDGINLETFPLVLLYAARLAGYLGRRIGFQFRNVVREAVVERLSSRRVAQRATPAFRSDTAGRKKRDDRRSTRGAGSGLPY